MMRVLAVNAGSSTLKLSLLAADGARLDGKVVEVNDVESAERALSDALADLGQPDAVGHRVVHGGSEFTGPVLIDDAIRSKLDSYIELAPLHQPGALAGIDLVGRTLPNVPAVACFDTAFHTTIPAAASTYALPAQWRAPGVRKYGFHGLSHAYATRRAAELIGSPPARLVTCHLGAGASLAAVRDGRCVDTTMGFTPIAGLVMASRSGDVDPGLLTWLQRRLSLSPETLEAGLNRRSGLAGLAGTPDMREVLRGASSGDSDAGLALEVYLHRLRAYIAAMAAAVGGLDALVFTGGVGERAPLIRSRVAAGLGFLGLELDHGLDEDADADADPAPDTDISAPGSAVRCLVIAAREDVQIAEEVRSLLAPPPPSAGP